MLDLCSHQKKSDKTMIWQKNLPTVQVHLELRNFHGYLGNLKIKINKIKNLRLSLYSEQRQSSIVSIWVQRWCKGWLVKCFIYLQKTSTIKRTSSTRNPNVSRVLACYMGVDHLMSGHQLCDKESLVSVFLGGLGGIRTVATWRQQIRDATDLTS